ncbi:MAG TPA: hypothetical protein VIL39_02210 [Verrucomicrobiae bacterium]
MRGRNSRELVRAMDAEKWFGLMPEAVGAAKAARESGAAGKIVALPKVPGQRARGSGAVDRGNTVWSGTRTAASEGDERISL